jgi:hypothetical protein
VTRVGPTSIGGLEIIGIIGTDGDIVTYAAEHPIHGIVAVTILSASASSAPGAVEEFLADAQRRADLPDNEHHVDHGMDGDRAFLINRIHGDAPTVHPLPPPVRIWRRRVGIGIAVAIVLGAIATLVQSPDIATASPDGRSWAAEVGGEWMIDDAELPLTLSATSSPEGLRLFGEPVSAPNAERALDQLLVGLDPSVTASRVTAASQDWEQGVDVQRSDGSEALIRLISRPCGAFALTVESTGAAFTAEQRIEATQIVDSFRRTGDPVVFEKGAEAPSGFAPIEQNGIRIAVPDGWDVRQDTSNCASATSADGEPTVQVSWRAGLDENGWLSAQEAAWAADDLEVRSAGVTSRGKQRRVVEGPEEALVAYVIEDDSGVFVIEMNEATTTGFDDSDLLVFDLIASTFEITG